MHIHILGICGTFMGGIAQIARELGHDVSGSDQNVYPPMSTQLEEMGIQLKSGYTAANLTPRPDKVIIGNALSRGNSAVEYTLNEGIPYDSGPAWLKENVLVNRHVIAISGTHGKTTTSSMVAWILEYAGLNPGFLIGGVPENFGVSARLGTSPYFVIEADEYDTAFFDKRSKFVHYNPKTCIINNIEYDHADIFEDLAAIKKQFHHLIRIVPQKGTVIYPENDKNAQSVLEMGCWSQTACFALDTGNDWSVKLEKRDGSVFSIYHQGALQGTVNWNLLGEHNAQNALAAVIAASTAGVKVATACKALGSFKSVKRRLEKKGIVNGVTIYDDFAHHPTAIHETLKALRSHIGQVPLLAVLDLRSNTMKMGVHRNTLVQSLSIADQIWIYRSPDIEWPVEEVFASLGKKVNILNKTDDIIQSIVQQSQPDAHVCIMSNGGFDNLHMRLLSALNDSHTVA